MIRRSFAILTALAIGGGLASVTELASAQVSACVARPGIAHRGGTERYAENTRNAFRRARNSGNSFWETDVRFTADSVPVIMHDPDVDRTTNGTGKVADLTYAEISRLRTSDGQPVPTLADVVNDAQVDGAQVFVELKTNPTNAQWSAFKAALTSRPGMTSKLTLASFDSATLDEARAKVPGFKRALVQGLGDANPAAVTPHASILIKHHHAITAGRMAKWTGAGLKVYTWTANTASEWQRMTRYPISGIVTDRPAAYLAWQRSRRC
ncbi:glycerophosphoryl diester phosphodiesterase [Krasilnikovia cinnamomea]|uniref:Glycerophosphoryl diester phosphodiesterase n=1 Tax=Krasilnikovia cinnamomea TaxID=349313 RepID=A0A4Q7ZPK3_9ACTN|nr:glycerophosphodiester phosphodiesterase family protein [Krasilnikovia cinnamomea]RZU52345.1 glycerophosphoryl diester phosphodiesterase [Krasilnikovia cinnamomea]